MSWENLLNAQPKPLITLLLSIFILLLFILIAVKGNLLFYLHKNHKKISFALIVATLLLLPILSISIGSHFFSSIVAKEFFYTLFVSILITVMVYLSLKLIGKIERRMAAVQSDLKKQVRVIDIKREHIVGKDIHLILTNQEASILINILSAPNLFRVIDNSQFANLVKLLIMAQDNKEIPLDCLLYAIETITLSSENSPEVLVELLKMLNKNSSEVKEDYFNNLRDEILQAISFNLMKIDSYSRQEVIHSLADNNITVRVEVKPTREIIILNSQEEYERSKELSYFLYDPLTTIKYRVESYEPSIDNTVRVFIQSAQVDNLEQLFENFEPVAQF